MSRQTIWKPHVTVATVVPLDGRYLFVEEHVRGHHVVNQPAGHLDPGESLTDAARRETREETGYEVELESLIGIYQWKSRSEKEFLRVAFAARVVDHDPDAELDDGILRAIWLSPDELNGHRLRSPMVMQNIRDFETGRNYPLSIIRNLNL